MTQKLADELVSVVTGAAARLRGLTDEAASAKRRPDVWSVKQIVGHLIDSAANNHQRFVRAQLATRLEFPAYAQDDWVRIGAYQDRPWLELVDFWAQYNQQLADVIRRIPQASLEVPCRIGTGDPVTLGFLVEDYVTHLRHHLKQIDERLAF